MFKKGILILTLVGIGLMGCTNNQNINNEIIEEDAEPASTRFARNWQIH